MDWFILLSAVRRAGVANVVGTGRMAGMSEITPEEKLLNRAIALAAEIHQNQVRRPPDSRPYICHVLDVVNALPHSDHQGRLVAALHDTIEDAPSDKDDEATAARKRAEVLARIDALGVGPEVLEAVTAISHLKSTGEEAEYLEYIKGSVKPNALASRVKIVDNYVNMRDMVGDSEANKAKLHQYASSIAELTK